MVDFKNVLQRRAQGGASLANGETLAPKSGIGALPPAPAVAVSATASPAAVPGAEPVAPAKVNGFGRFRVNPGAAQAPASGPAGDGAAAVTASESSVSLLGGGGSLDFDELGRVLSTRLDEQPDRPRKSEPSEHVETKNVAEEPGPPGAGRSPIEADAAPVRVNPMAVAAGAAALRAKAQPRSLPRAEAAEPRTYAAPVPSAFSRFVVDPSTLPTAEARRDVHAIKVVTRLVAGIAFEPGSDASPAQKVEALRSRMDEMQRAAGELAEKVSPGNVTGWVRGQCCETIAEMIGKRCERAGAFQDVQAAVSAVGDVIASASHDERVAEIVDGLADARYRTADDRETAQARIMVSTASAVWDCFDRVSAATVQGRPYSFHRNPVEIAEQLVSSIHEVANSMAIEIGDVDMQVAHLQGSLRRLSTLISAEYCAQIARADDWIAEGDKVGEGERGVRLAALQKRSDSIIVDAIRVGTENFRAVEGIAPKLLEESLARESARHNETARSSVH